VAVRGNTGPVASRDPAPKPAPVTGTDEVLAESTPADQSPRREYAGAGFVGGVAVLFVVGVILVALIAQNADAVTFRLLWFEAEIALAALLLGVAVLAVLISELVGVVWRRRRRAFRTMQDRNPAS
jgi:uncharacterized integral membrane protein